MHDARIMEAAKAAYPKAVADAERLYPEASKREKAMLAKQWALHDARKIAWQERGE